MSRCLAALVVDAAEPVAASMQLLGGITVLVLGCIIAMGLYGVASTWLLARREGVPLGLVPIVKMRFRGADPSTVIRAAAMARHGRVNVSLRQLEAHFRSRGRVVQIVAAMIEAQRVGVDVPWSALAAIDLAGRDVHDAVRSAVQPRTMEVPSLDSGMATINAVAQDGIEVRMRAEVGYVLNIAKVISGTSEPFLNARVGVAMVEIVGAMADHRQALTSTEAMGRQLVQMKLDEGSAFIVQDITITHIERGDDVVANIMRARREGRQAGDGKSAE